MRSLMLIGLAIVLTQAPVSAQVRSTPTAAPVDDAQDDLQPIVKQQQTPPQPNQAGRTAQSSAGQVGERQTRDTAAEQTGIKPMGRIASRIQNRIQNRLRTRIDRNYDPQANTTDPFAVAEEQTRTTGRPR